MNRDAQFLELRNGGSVPWADLPAGPAADLAAAVGDELECGGRLCAWFGVREPEGVRLVAVVARDRENLLLAGRSRAVPGGYPSLTPRQPQAHLFEREIWEQHGIVPEGHPWLKPVRGEPGHGPQAVPFFRVEGAEVHEVAVGPVHAGIIEPGHFRFQCNGEEVLHLEIALGYQHRGVEEALVDGPHPASIFQIETVAGDSTIAHATAHASVCEALAGGEAPLRAQWLRAIALELERMANHAGGLGALSGDVAYLPTAAACGRIRGELLNLTALLCGNRFGRGLVRPGGCRHDLEAGRAGRLGDGLEPAFADFMEAADWLWDSHSVGMRFEGTGIVPGGVAHDLGLVGVASRASGLDRDVRRDHPAGWHRYAEVPVAKWSGGDVLARARIRWLEVGNAAEFIRGQLRAAPDGPVRTAPGEPAPCRLAVSLVEGWRGEVCHVAITGQDRRWLRYKIVDPSFHNWAALACAMRGQALSDFPLCNKSFDLSYCGFDL